ncbi:Splicing regulator RBM11 [Camelus dromedarius]|uniref:Splicing regulator RBM11 n=1 Tax=Camelus dromedarius TaxID=9838 RepID=A0A5N4EKY3_CAMDR|nr:Splicing regulator RBM11 [Camelus dromedarius]
MFPAQEEADRTVFVGNLEARVREEILYELFLQHPESVSYAIALLNGIRLYGRPINVQYRFAELNILEETSNS